MNKLQIKIDINEFNSIDEIPDYQKQLIEAAKKATDNAYAPYSDFHVGAAVLLENGEIVTGTNQENSAYPSGLCAERVALFYANHKYPNIPVKALAVCAFYKGEFVGTPTPPCGSCRQVMLETENRFKKPMEVILYGSQKIHVISSASSLLPLTFTGDNLK